MQNESCQNNDVLILSKSVVETGNIDDLLLLAKLLNEKVKMEMINLDGLDTLIVYYLYYVWMDKDTKENFPSFRDYLLYDQAHIWEQLLDGSFTYDWESKNGVSDIYIKILNDIGYDIVFRMTGGRIGRERKQNFIFTGLMKLLETKYSSIPDFLLKLLFIGYATYGRDLFATDLEFAYFEAFLFDKCNLVYCSKEPDCHSYEEQLLALDLV